MKGQIFVEIALIGVLAIHGLHVAARVAGLRSPGGEQVVIDRNKRLAFGDARGIDPWGGHINVGGRAGTRRLIAFVVRNASVKEDLDFWRDVVRHLPDPSGVQVVGYCEGAACVKAVGNGSRMAELPIIAYAEMIASQAVLNADAEGNFLLKADDHSRSIRWRQPTLTPADVVRSVSP